ncbi:MAG: hypothetical protein D6791_11965 [Chloroflexi bacterium]|nr:MAG: hypothetical protein D6791_11965 [Chloroflexota bacterium]
MVCGWISPALSRYLVCWSALAFLAMPTARATDPSHFLNTKSWDCTLEISLKRTDEGRSRIPGSTDRYRKQFSERISGRIRIHDVQEFPDDDAIRLAAWRGGEAHASIRHEQHWTEQNGVIIRDSLVTYDGPVKFYGDEEEPGFLVWLMPEEKIYAIQWGFAPVKAQRISHCRIKGGEAEQMRKELEQMPPSPDQRPMEQLGRGLARTLCASEKRTTTEISGKLFGGSVVDIPLPSSLVLEGEGKVENEPQAKARWSCRPL